MSDPPIVLPCSPCLTDCARSPREHRLACRLLGRREGAKDSNPQGGHCMARIWDIEPGEFSTALASAPGRHSGSGSEFNLPRLRFQLRILENCPAPMALASAPNTWIMGLLLYGSGDDPRHREAFRLRLRLKYLDGCGQNVSARVVLVRL